MTNIASLANKVGQTETVSCWIYNQRSSGKLAFLQLRDGTGFIQAIVARESVPGETWELCSRLRPESAIAVTGLVCAHPKRPEEIELQVTNVDLLGLAQDDYPIAKKSHGPDHLLKHRHLWLRSKRQWAIMRIRDQIIWSIREFMRNQGFVLVDAPILTKTACEGTTDLSF